MSKTQRPTPSLDGIESRAWQFAEIFKIIDEAAPIATDDEISICTIALLGRELATELAEYAGGQRDSILGMAPTPPAAPNRFSAEEILHSYRQTIDAAEALMHAINAADLKRAVPVAERAAIDEAMHEMLGHCDAVRDDFLGRAGS